MPSPKRLPKKRADEIVLERGLAESRAKAQAFILAETIEWKELESSTWQLVKKAGQFFEAARVEFRIRGDLNLDVGRGAQKLRHAFEFWKELDAREALALDIGSSTGGFTQVLLERGARRVVALDVGTHQLHERLRSDPRVISMEQQHVLKVEDDTWRAVHVSPPFDILVTDLSFISVTKILAKAADWLKSGGDWIVLVKPQFELGPKKTPGGVVKREVDQLEALDTIRKYVSGLGSLEWKDSTPSPIRGGEGNKEFLAWLQKK